MTVSQLPGGEKNKTAQKLSILCPSFKCAKGPSPFFSATHELKVNYSQLEPDTEWRKSLWWCADRSCWRCSVQPAAVPQWHWHAPQQDGMLSLSLTRCAWSSSAHQALSYTLAFPGSVFRIKASTRELRSSCGLIITRIYSVTRSSAINTETGRLRSGQTNNFEEGNLPLLFWRSKASSRFSLYALRLSGRLRFP